MVSVYDSNVEMSVREQRVPREKTVDDDTKSKTPSSSSRRPTTDLFRRKITTTTTTTTIAQENQTTVRGIKTPKVHLCYKIIFWGGGARDRRHIRIIRYLTRKFLWCGDSCVPFYVFRRRNRLLAHGNAVTCSGSSTSVQSPRAPLYWVYVLYIIIACVRAQNYAAASVYNNMQKRFASTASTRARRRHRTLTADAAAAAVVAVVVVVVEIVDGHVVFLEYVNVCRVRSHVPSNSVLRARERNPSPDGRGARYRNNNNNIL